MIDLENRRDQLVKRIEESLRRTGLTIDDITERFFYFDREKAANQFHLTPLELQRLLNTLDHDKPTPVILGILIKGLPPGTDEKLSEQVQPIIEPVVQMCDERKNAVIVVDHDTNRGGTDPAVRRLSPVIMATTIPGSLRRGMSTQALGGSAALARRSGRPGTTDHPLAGSWKQIQDPARGWFS
jgi:RecA-family ATPase